MLHETTNVEIDVSIDNEPPKRNTMLLSLYGQFDARFSKLCRAVKKWAAESGVENSRNGRINSFSICLLLIHYLQRVKVLPNLQRMFPELNKAFDVNQFNERNIAQELRNMKSESGNDGNSLGALYWGFMKYYSEFVFRKNWISVQRRAAMEKRRDEEKVHWTDCPNNQVVELELELDRIFWEDRELLKGRVERQKPYEFYLAKKSMKEFWLEVTPMMFL
uniref:PAP-associated domain-containing protein n=1 Tax=Caenorhabditis tropicalis TaxID=1561998 RepID=A0A1I7TAX7_9PELO